MQGDPDMVGDDRENLKVGFIKRLTRGRLDVDDANDLT